MRPKNKSRIPFIICFYRMFGITFGGLSVSSNGEILEKKSQNIWLYLCFYGNYSVDNRNDFHH